MLLFYITIKYKKGCCRPDGRVEIEEHGEVTSREVMPSVSGFVVDNQPDLRVSRVLPWLLLGR